MDKELRLRRPLLGVAGNKPACIDDQVLAALVVDAVLVHPGLQALRAGEHSNTLALSEALARFGANKARVDVKAFF